MHRSRPAKVSAPRVAALIGALFGCLATSTLAQDEAPLREFTVEVIVFENLSASTEEHWNYVPSSDRSDAADSDKRRELAALRFQVADSLTLDDIFTKMRQSRDYRPLVHTAWTQPGYSEATAPPLPLDRVTRLPRNLSGEITLHLSRYLHLNVDLTLAANRSAGADQSQLLLNERPMYRLQESRRMRSGDLHFFDHPKFGVLARIQPVETPATDGG